MQENTCGPGIRKTAKRRCNHCKLITRATDDTKHLADRALQTLAMKSYLEARRWADLKRVIATRLLPNEGPFAPGNRLSYWQIDKSKIKQGTMTGKWYKARVLSQEKAICVIDTETSVLRVNQTKLRQEEGAWNDVALPPDSPPLPPPSDSVPRERLDVPREQAMDQLPSQGAPEVFWIAPRGVRTDVMKLSSGSGSFLALCSQHGLRTGSCLTMGNELSHSSGCAESWSCFIDSQPALLYIEPPPVTSLRQEHKRAIACFCLKATLQQVKQGRHFVLVHPQKSTL